MSNVYIIKRQRRINGVSGASFDYCDSAVTGADPDTPWLKCAQVYPNSAALDQAIDAFLRQLSRSRADPDVTILDRRPNRAHSSTGHLAAGQRLGFDGVAGNRAAATLARERAAADKNLAPTSITRPRAFHSLPVFVPPRAPDKIDAINRYAHPLNQMFELRYAMLRDHSTDPDTYAPGEYWLAEPVVYWHTTPLDKWWFEAHDPRRDPDSPLYDPRRSAEDLAAEHLRKNYVVPDSADPSQPPGNHPPVPLPAFGRSALLSPDTSKRDAFWTARPSDAGMRLRVPIDRHYYELRFDAVVWYLYSGTFGGPIHFRDTRQNWSNRTVHIGGRRPSAWPRQATG